MDMAPGEVVWMDVGGGGAQIGRFSGADRATVFVTANAPFKDIVRSVGRFGTKVANMTKRRTAVNLAPRKMPRHAHQFQRIL